MSLCSPTIVGPVSELSVSLRVKGAVPGATLTIVSVGAIQRDIATGTASGGDERIPLNTGIILRSDDVLLATQKLGNEGSTMPDKNSGLSVQAAPKTANDIGPVGYLSHLFECGEYLWITGAVPGATVEVSFGGSVKGNIVALEEGARLSLTDGLPLGAVTAKQVTPIGNGPDTVGHSDPVIPRQLPAPIIRQPLLGCQTAVLVSGVYDGATVTLKRSSGIVDTGGFDRNALWFMLSRPLDETDKAITAQQDLAKKCERKGIESSPPVPVNKRQGLPAPVVIPPLCIGSRSVRIANLVPGALVHIDVNGAQFTGMAPSESAIYDFKIEPLPNGTVKATQELCSIMSQASVAVPVDPHQENIPGAKLIEPLYSCGRAVFIENVHPGATLQVWRRDPSGQEAPISGFVSIYEVKSSIEVTPYLREKDQVWVAQQACGDDSVKSNLATVVLHPSIQLPNIVEPVYSGVTTVNVSDAVPGGLVEVYLSTKEGWTFAGRAIASSDKSSPIPLNVTLTPDNQLRARQSLCETQTEPGRVATVIRPLPHTPVLDSPSSDATNVERKPILSWHDPAAGQDGRADSYELQLQRGNTVVTSLAAVTATNFQVVSELDYATQYTWQVRAKNASGLSGFALSSFTVKPEPPAPSPVLISYDVATSTLKGANFLPSHAVFVTVTVLGNAVNNYGVSVSDLRSIVLQFTSDPQGNLSVVINRDTALPIRVIDNLGGYIQGCNPGEQITFMAHDQRHNSNNTLLYTNPLILTC